MTGPIARILLRYISGALVAYGLIGEGVGNQIATDPDLAILVGAGVGLMVELGYVTAKRLGWAT